MSERPTAREVADKAAEAMIAMGQSPISVWRCFYPCCVKIVHFHERKGMEYYDPKITAEFVALKSSLFENGQVSRAQRNFFRKTAERMDEVFLTGRIRWSCKSRHRREPLNACFSALHKEYLGSSSFHSNTQEDVNWAIYRHLHWLMKNGHEDFRTVTERNIGEYISQSARELVPGSLRNILSYTKRFYDFVRAKGEIDIAHEGFLSVSIHRPEKIQPPTTLDELDAVLAQINRATPLGKRDYAAILLGARIGMRAADIVCMKLQDIDWKSNQIKISQQKTSEMLVMPLPADVGAALREYILRARPTSDYGQVFLRVNAPFQPLAAGAALGYAYQKYQQKAGIERKAFDGKGFHSLRRMLGTEMTVAGVPATTVAQVLGHRNLNTVKQYISLDTVHLKECALDFRGIELAGGAL
jgi:site-specific recombinase XerD